MKNILILGAGLSSTHLIDYLLTQSEVHGWQITVADRDIRLAQSKIHDHSNALAIETDSSDEHQLRRVIEANDLVVSMLPASMHIRVAQICLEFAKHLFTASYTALEMRALHQDVLKKNLLFLNECGLDPGIDHMSAVKMIHEIQRKGGQVTSFRSYCGGLVAKEFDNNPWHYKFTWNPRNVVLAGQQTARYLESNQIKFIPPARIFTQTVTVKTNSNEAFECYANRDSLEYITPYGLDTAHTVLRGTMRVEGFCKAWNSLVQLGLTDDSFPVHTYGYYTYRDLLNAFVPGNEPEKLEERLADFLSISTTDPLFMQLQWLGLFDLTPIPLNEATPAQILQQLLIAKWKLLPGELDRIIMHHELEYDLNGQHFGIKSSLEVKGDDEIHTAMSKTVGLPLAISVKLMMLGKLKSRGVQLPIQEEIYTPVLNELAAAGIQFNEVESEF